MNILRLFFSFYGRINRAKYWTGWAIAYGIIGIAMAVWALMPLSDTTSFAAGLVSIISLFTLIPVATKRLHDLDITGWWVPAFLVVYGLIVVKGGEIGTSLGSLVLFVAVVWLGSKKGDPEANRHGPSPI